MFFNKDLQVFNKKFVGALQDVGPPHLASPDNFQDYHYMNTQHGQIN
jgi:hypothetical protein